MPRLGKAQVMVLDGALSLLLAIMLSYVLFAAWPRAGTQQETWLWKEQAMIL